MFTNAFAILILVFYTVLSKASATEILEETKLNFTNIASKYGLHCEEYDVTTEDGYILKLFNIPGNKTKPILISHGLADSADSLILRGKTSIVYLLAKRGYDVWAGNGRGNRYSRRHVTLNPDTDLEYWNFSMQERGIYDLPASIDFILNKSKVNRLSLIGYSEGSSIMFILGSLKPEYNDKINILIAWSPTCYMDYTIGSNPFNLSIVKAFYAILSRQQGEILNDGSIPSAIIEYACTRYSRLCSFTLSVGSPTLDSLEPDHVRVLFSYYPAGTSAKNLVHYVQTIITQRYAQFDYGPVKNLEKYNSPLPPEYDVHKVNSKVALYTGDNDIVSTKMDLNTLRRRLPNVVFYKVVKQMNHLGFTQSQFAPSDVFPSVFKLLKKYT